MSGINNVLTSIDKNLDEALERLFELVRMESISTDPVFAEECKKTAKWLVDDLVTIGFDAKVCETTGHPMVLAHHHKKPGAPTVLFYGHYDVQPVDPIELWNMPPFEPSIVALEDGSKHITGRGTSDDKGQLMTFVEACRNWLSETGEIPLNVTILFEGEEESGSPSLLPFLEEYKEELKADVALVCDTNMWNRETPAICTSLRGLVGEQFTVRAANRDLHSGYYGSAAANPIHILTKILADLHDENGSITLEGFYDGVPEVPKDIKASWDKLGFSESEFLGEIGLKYPAGEKDRSVLEQTWTRPTAEVNGIFGGYTGEGFKTVIAAEASAKVSFRLVGTQDPDQVHAAFKKHVEARIPKDCSVVFHDPGGSPGVPLDYNLPELKKAVSALGEEWGKDTALIAMGGSIPIVGSFKNMLGIDSLLIGFAQADDRIHSPNEKYELKSFHKGTRSWARVMAALAE